jgi:hypothetical protein
MIIRPARVRAVVEAGECCEPLILQVAVAWLATSESAFRRSFEVAFVVDENP